jgi:predicted nucleic acid-binding protein
LNRPKIAIHTDVILEYLIHHGPDASALRIAMMKFFCYTTVFNAIELFSRAATEHEREAVAASMGAMKILGLNAKQAVRYGAWFAEYPRVPAMSLLVAGVCLDSKLPILTGDRKTFRGITGLHVVPLSAIKTGASAVEILRSAVTA